MGLVFAVNRRIPFAVLDGLIHMNKLIDIIWLAEYWTTIRRSGYLLNRKEAR